MNELASHISETDKLKILIHREDQTQKEKDEMKLRTIPALEFTKSDPKSTLFFMKSGKNLDNQKLKSELKSVIPENTRLDQKLSKNTRVHNQNKNI